MRICCTGDWHYRPTVPRSRKDKYVRTHRHKIAQILGIAFGDDHGHSEDCRYILQPGDFFDSSTPPMWMVRAVMHQLRGLDDPDILVVYGQHDQRYHSNRVENTPLAVMEAANIVRVLGPEPFAVIDEEDNDEPVFFYGCSWDGDIPKRLEGRGTHILVMHRMVVDEKLWEAQEDYAKPRPLLRKHPFDLIVTGDNHHYFVDEYKKRFLINCGSLMRTNIDQADHEPGVVIFDTHDHTIKEIKLRVASIEDVLRIEEAQAEKARNADLEAFIQQIKGGDPDHSDLDFLAAVDRLSHTEDVEAGVTAMVDRIIGMATE